MCKPHKTGGANRWKPKDRVKMKEMDREIEALSGYNKVPDYYGDNKPEYIAYSSYGYMYEFDDYPCF